MDDDLDQNAPTFCVDVLLPLALERPYTYLVPTNLPVRVGNYVQVPLGPRERIGVVWSDPYPISQTERPDRQSGRSCREL